MCFLMVIFFTGEIVSYCSRISSYPLILYCIVCLCLLLSFVYLCENYLNWFYRPMAF